jgi:FAD/FMN-containing dehydrogenase
MVLLRQLSLLLFSLFVSTGIADTGNATQACQFLQSILPGRIFFPGSQGYESSIASYAYLGTRLRPICVAGPQVSVDVVTIIKTLSIFNNVAFAIRSGGHNTNKGRQLTQCTCLLVLMVTGFADIEHGITIDLSRMNSVQLDGSASVVSVGPGARWQKVYDALDPYQLSIQGGRNGIVGVGGFLLGGTPSSLIIA